MGKQMNAYQYCKERQKRWALQRGLTLLGSAGDRGEAAYTSTLEANLFEPLSAEARREFEQGNGDELVGKGGPPKMHAVHSSAALACNVFHYWRHQHDLEPILAALRLPDEHVVSLEFEAKRPIMDDLDRRVFRIDPNLDVLMGCGGPSRFREIAVECKFTEPYRPCEPDKKGLKWPYLKDERMWAVLPACRQLGRQLSPCDDHFKHLHAAQLLKHILGLKHRNGAAGFCLVYLWFDVPCADGQEHRREIDEFSKAIAADGICFRAITYQEVISSLIQCDSSHDRYSAYLAERYGG